MTNNKLDKALKISALSKRWKTTTFSKKLTPDDYGVIVAWVSGAITAEAAASAIGLEFKTISQVVSWLKGLLLDGVRKGRLSLNVVTQK